MSGYSGCGLVIGVWIVILFIGGMFFFFFKQKTAYEMRISDWSSDVCSSDLVLRVGRKFAGVVADVVQQRGGDEGVPRPRALRQERGLQIGRASCRERVCQYV